MRDLPIAAASVTQSYASGQTNNLMKIEKKIEEDTRNDDKILTDLDTIIHNLEKQQQADTGAQGKFTSKFTSNREARQQDNEEQVIPESLQLQNQGSSNFEVVEEIHVERPGASQLREGAAASLTQTDVALQDAVIHRQGGPESSRADPNMKETVRVDDGRMPTGGGQFRIARPISASNSVATNRYGTKYG